MYNQKTAKNPIDHGPARTERILGKSLPSNVTAERAVLSAILLNDENLSQVTDMLEAGDFYSPVNRMIYEGIIALASDNKRIDLLTLQNELEGRGQLETIGGLSFLMELQEDIPSVGLIAQHAGIVKEKQTLRDLITTSADIISRCYDEKGAQLLEILDTAEKKIFEVSKNRSTESFVQLDVWLKRTFEHLASVRGLREGVTGVPTGFTKFDDMTSGMQRGDLLIYAGRPSMGKTALAMNIVNNAAKEGFGVGIFSLEMSAEQLVLRMLSSESAIPHQRIRNALITSDEWVELTNTAAQLAEASIFIEDTPGLSIMELRAKARKLKAKHDIDLIVIDYLQLINGSRRYENRTQEISEISRSLKGLAKELNIPVLALSQLSRQLENRMDKRPILSDLRDSGAIEQDGDVIFFIYRDVVYNPDSEHPELAEVIIGKQRNGPTGTVYVKFNGETATFDDIPADAY